MCFPSTCKFTGYFPSYGNLQVIFLSCISLQVFFQPCVNLQVMFHSCVSLIVILPLCVSLCAIFLQHSFPILLYNYSIADKMYVVCLFQESTTTVWLWNGNRSAVHCQEWGECRKIRWLLEHFNLKNLAPIDIWLLLIRGSLTLTSEALLDIIVMISYWIHDCQQEKYLSF